MNIIVSFFLYPKVSNRALFLMIILKLHYCQWT